MSFRIRLTLLYGALLGLVLGVALGFVYVVHSDSHVKEVESQLARASDNLQDDVRDGAAVIAFALSPQLTGDTHLTRFSALLLAADGAVMATTGRDRGAAFASVARDLPAGYSSLQLADDHLRVLVSPVGDRKRLVAAASLNGIDALMERLRNQLVAVSLSGIALAVALGLAVAGRALRPVDLVTETARSIASSRSFDRRVPELKRDDELGRLTRTVNSMLDALERSHLQQRRFVSDVSHELRTPLTSIQGCTELALAPDLSRAERREAVLHAQEEAARLSRLVEDLLVLARADEGTEPLPACLVELDALLMELFAELRLRAAGRLSVNTIDALAVRGSPDRLKQLLLIALDNALRYTPAPGRVYVSLRRDATEAVVTVEDEGIGVTSEVVGRAFERFYRSDEARRLEPSGSGLGLAIARWIAGQHGGRITLAPRAPCGTSVVIRLPLGPDPDSLHAPAVTSSVPASARA